MTMVSDSAQVNAVRLGWPQNAAIQEASSHSRPANTRLTMMLK